MTKPTVFNYKQHEELRQAYKELLADNQQLIADNRKLRKEVGELKQLNDGYVKIIAKNQETNNKLMASVQKQTGGDLISRADAIEAVLGLAQLNGRVPTDSVIFQIKALPSADAEKPCKTCGYYNLECPKDCEYQSADAVPKKPKCYWCAYWNSETKGCKRNPSVQAWEEDDYCSYYVAIEALNREQQIIENGYTGKEMRIRIGGKLFAVRELAQ